MPFIKIYLIVALSLLFVSNGVSQELEPRAMTNLPIGTNFILGGYGYSNGNLLLDPALTFENLNSNVHSGLAAYVRSINLFGLSAKLDAILPYVLGDWEGNINENYLDQTRNGFGDLRLRISFNFLGSKAMNVSEFKEYKPKQISGLSVQLIMPTGSYNSNDLINVGSNRWAIKSQWGFAQFVDKWVFEAYVGMWLFTKNTDYLMGNELTQKPLYTLKTHLIRELPKMMWASVGVGYGIGGQAQVNGIDRDTEISTLRLSLDYAIPFGKKHSIKFNYATGIRFKKGPDFDAISIAYQFRWNNNVKKLVKHEN